MRNRGTPPPETDYRGIFILGVCLLGSGTTLMATIGPAFISFLGAGIAFVAIGLANRAKWKVIKADRK